MPDKSVGRVSDMALLIKAIHAETRGAYGWPRIWRELRQRNVRVGKEREACWEWLPKLQETVVKKMVQGGHLRLEQEKSQS